jgi:prepilin-type N-terminal cleavage/methylation domain-containing protein
MLRIISHNMWASRYNQRGFTIVELLVVIIVIGILAGVVTMSYQNSKTKTRFASYRNDITRINEALATYNSTTGKFPVGSASASGCVDYTPANANFIPGLVPTYLSPMPQPTNYNSGENYYTYCWGGNGTDYKILRSMSTGKTVPSAEQTSDVTADPVRGWRAWGLWSPGGSAL